MASLTRLGQLAGCLLAGLALCAPAARAGVNEWTSHGPYVADVRDLAVHPLNPSRLYAATSGGVSVSTDAGATWRDAGGLGEAAFAVAIDPRHPLTLYAATSCDVHKSADAGATWTALNVLGAEGYDCGFNDLAVDPRDSEVVYLADHGDTDGCPGCYRGWLYKSADGGATWAAIDVGGTYDHYAVAVDPFSTVYVGTNLGVHRSRDGGATWELVNEGFPDGWAYATALAIDPTRPSKIYAAAARGIYRSRDGGGSWSRLYFAGEGEVVSLAVDPGHPAILYAGVWRYGVGFESSGIYRSRDGGVSWSVVDRDVDGRLPRALAVAPGDPPAVYAGTYTGVLRSRDRGRSWKALAVPATTRAGVLALAAAPARPASGKGVSLFAGTAGAGVFRSDDDGKSWQAAHAGLFDGNVHALAVDPGQPASRAPATVYAGTTRRVFRSVDGGATWKAARPFCDGYCNVNALALDRRTRSPMAVYAAVSGGLFRSRDGGRTWADLSAGLPDRYVTAVAVDSRGPRTGRPSIIYASSGPALVRSDDGGETWVEVGAGVTGGYLLELVVEPGPKLPGSGPATLYAAGYNGALRSDDGGETWTDLRADCYDFGFCSASHAIAIDPRQPSTIYTDGESAVLKSSDRGGSWDRLGGPLLPSVEALVIHPGRALLLHAATYTGVYELVQADCDAPGPAPGAGDP